MFWWRERIERMSIHIERTKEEISYSPQVEHNGKAAATTSNSVASVTTRKADTVNRICMHNVQCKTQQELPGQFIGTSVTRKTGVRSKTRHVKSSKTNFHYNNNTQAQPKKAKYIKRSSFLFSTILLIVWLHELSLSKSHKFLLLCLPFAKRIFFYLSSDTITVSGKSTYELDLSGDPYNHYYSTVCLQDNGTNSS